MAELKMGCDISVEKGVKVRLAECFRKEGQKMTEIMAEIKELDAKDLADFALWFNEQGIPTRG